MSSLGEPRVKPPWPCADCGQLIIGEKTWRSGTDELRATYGMHMGQGRCNPCYHRLRRGTVGGASYNHQTIAELIEDVEWLIGTDNPESIAARVGYERPESLARRLERNGRPDLARIFDQARNLERAS